MSYVTLSHMAEIQLGKMLSPNSKTGTASFSYLRNQNVQWGRIDVSDLSSMDFSERERKKFELRKGDLLVCEGGEPGRCAVWQGELADCYYQKAIHRVRPYPGIADSEFLYLWIRHQALMGAFADQNFKTTIAHLPLVRLEQLPIPALGIVEQRQIAAHLEFQLAAVEEARQAAHAQVQDARRLEVALRQAAFQEVLASCPRDVAFADVCRISAGGTPSRGKLENFRGNIPWVKTLDLNLGVVLATEEKISDEAFGSMRGEILPVGTVMVAMYGGAGTIGKSGILGIEACTNQAVCSLRPKYNLLNGNFLHEWVRFIRPEWMRYSGGNRKDPNINKSVVEAMTLPLPPLSVQSEFCKVLNEKISQARLILESAQAQLDEIKRLPGRLLAQAFDSKGETDHD